MHSAAAFSKLTKFQEKREVIFCNDVIVAVAVAVEAAKVKQRCFLMLFFFHELFAILCCFFFFFFCYADAIIYILNFTGMLWAILYL